MSGYQKKHCDHIAAEFASRLAWALARRGVTKKKLADAAGVHPSAIGRYMSGEATPRGLSTVKRMADFLGVSPVWLSGYGTNPEAETPTERDLAQIRIDSLLSDLSDEDVIKAKDVLVTLFDRKG